MYCARFRCVHRRLYWFSLALIALLVIWQGTVYTRGAVSAANATSVPSGK